MAHEGKEGRRGSEESRGSDKGGGGVTVCLLANGVFLFSFHRHTHLLFGMYSYNWICCLLLFDSSNTVLIEL